MGWGYAEPAPQNLTNRFPPNWWVSKKFGIYGSQIIWQKKWGYLIFAQISRNCLFILKFYGNCWKVINFTYGRNTGIKERDTNQVPGDSIRDLLIPDRWRSRFGSRELEDHHPRKVTIAELKSSWGPRLLLLLDSIVIEEIIYACFQDLFGDVRLNMLQRNMDLLICKRCFKKGTCFFLNMRTENGIEYAALEVLTWHLWKSGHCTQPNLFRFTDIRKLLRYSRLFPKIPMEDHPESDSHNL